MLIKERSTSLSPSENSKGSLSLSISQSLSLSPSLNPSPQQQQILLLAPFPASFVPSVVLLATALQRRFVVNLSPSALHQRSRSTGEVNISDDSDSGTSCSVLKVSDISDGQVDIRHTIMVAAVTAATMVVNWYEETKEDPEAHRRDWIGTQSANAGTSAPLRKKKKLTPQEGVMQRVGRLCDTIEEFQKNERNLPIKVWEELKNLTTIDNDMMWKAANYLAQRPSLSKFFLGIEPELKAEWLQRIIPR